MSTPDETLEFSPSPILRTFDLPVFSHPGIFPLLPFFGVSQGKPLKIQLVGTHEARFRGDFVLSATHDHNSSLIDSFDFCFYSADLELLVLPPGALSHRRALFPALRSAATPSPVRKYADYLHSDTSVHIMACDKSNRPRASRAAANQMVDRITDDGRIPWPDAERIIRPAYGYMAKRIDISKLVDDHPELVDRAVILPDRFVSTLHLLPIGEFVVHKVEADYTTASYYQLAYRACNHTFMLPITSFGVSSYGSIILSVKYHADTNQWVLDVGRMAATAHNMGMHIPSAEQRRRQRAWLRSTGGVLFNAEGLDGAVRYLFDMAGRTEPMAPSEDRRVVGTRGVTLAQKAREKACALVMDAMPASAREIDPSLLARVRMRTGAPEVEMHFRVRRVAALLALSDRRVAYYASLWHSKGAREQEVMLRQPLFDVLGDAGQVRAWLWDRYKEALLMVTSVYWPGAGPVPARPLRPTNHWLVHQRGARGEEILRNQDRRLREELGVE